MIARKVGVAVVLGILAMVFWSSRRSDVKEVVIAEAMALLSEAANYEAEQKWYESRGKRASSSAFQKCTDLKVGESGEFVFDDERFLPEFFEKIIAAAQNEGKMKSVKALIAVRDDHGILRPTDG